MPLNLLNTHILHRGSQDMQVLYLILIPINLMFWFSCCLCGSWMLVLVVNYLVQSCREEPACHLLLACSYLNLLFSPKCPCIAACRNYLLFSLLEAWVMNKTTSSHISKLFSPHVLIHLLCPPTSNPEPLPALLSSGSVGTNMLTGSSTRSALFGLSAWKVENSGVSVSPERSGAPMSLHCWQGSCMHNRGAGKHTSTMYLVVERSQ